MFTETPKIPFFQAIRKSDNRIVTWYRRDGVDHLLPHVTGDWGETPLDMRVQWNEQDFYTQVPMSVDDER